MKEEFDEEKFENEIKKFMDNPDCGKGLEIDLDGGIKKSDYIQLKKVFNLLKISLLIGLFSKLVFIFLNINIIDETLVEFFQYLFCFSWFGMLISVERIVIVLKKHGKATISPIFWAFGCLVPFFNIIILILVWKRSKRLLMELK